MLGTEKPHKNFGKTEKPHKKSPRTAKPKTSNTPPPLFVLILYMRLFLVDVHHKSDHLSGTTLGSIQVELVHAYCFQRMLADACCPKATAISMILYHSNVWFPTFQFILDGIRNDKIYHISQTMWGKTDLNHIVQTQVILWYCSQCPKIVQNDHCLDNVHNGRIFFLFTTFTVTYINV